MNQPSHKKQDIYDEMKPKPKPIDTTLQRNKRMYVLKLNDQLIQHLKKY